MNIGFTGTRKGMTQQQESTLDKRLNDIEVRELIVDARHGDCVGADAEFHALAQERHFILHLLPCNLVKQRAYCTGAVEIDPPADPIVRNHRIVHRSELMFATPKEDHEILYSGTWATIRYAQKHGKHLIVIWPNGTITDFNKPQ